MDNTVFYANNKKIQEDYNSGKVTFNEMRKKYGLSPIEEGEKLISTMIPTEGGEAYD